MLNEYKAYLITRRRADSTIEGPDTAILRAVPLKNGGTVLATQVRKFAMDLNQAATRALTP